MKMQSDQQKLQNVYKNLLAGGITGMVSKSTVAPLDRVKILLQAHNKSYVNHGVFSGLRHIVKTESLLALYKSNGAQMARIFPYAATKFTAFETYKKLLNGSFKNETHTDKFIAGAGAGLTALFFTYPLDIIRSRLAFQISGAHLYTGIANTAISIVKKEGGFSALYRGFVPGAVGMVPYAGLTFYCFENLKSFCRKHLTNATCTLHQKNKDEIVLDIYAKIICGGLAGAIAQTVSYPLDVTRKRMQLANMDLTTQRFAKGMFTTLCLVYKENGVSKGLYRGLSINYLRAIPMTGVSFTSYELCKQLMNLNF